MEEGKTTNWKKYVFLLLVLGLLVFFLVILLVILIILYSSLFSTEEESHESNNFQYAEIQYSTGPSHNTKFGFMELNKKLQREDYSTYRNDETGSFIVITNMGGKEYECTGGCYCNENARRSSGVLTRSLVVLLSAFSIPMAMKIAEDAFKDQCLQKFADTCDEDNVVASADDCKVKEEFVEEITEKDLNKDYHFHCSGFCVNFHDLAIQNQDLATRASRRYGNCEDFKLKKSVSIFVDTEELYKAVNNWEFLKEKFIVQYLHPHCTKTTPVDVDVGDGKTIQVPYCVGRNSIAMNDFYNVKCFEVYSEEDMKEEGKIKTQEPQETPEM